MTLTGFSLLILSITVLLLGLGAYVDKKALTHLRMRVDNLERKIADFR